MVFYKKANFMYNSRQFYLSTHTVLRNQIWFHTPNTDPDLYVSIEYVSDSATLSTGNTLLRRLGGFSISHYFRI